MPDTLRNNCALQLVKIDEVISHRETEDCEAEDLTGFQIDGTVRTEIQQ